MTNKPNILFIIADDHRYDALGVAGDQIVQTPTLDHLAESGAMMSQTHIVGGIDGAVCVPCRACVQTGTHIFQATESQRLDNYAQASVIQRGRETMPSWFRQHGYYTHAIGKWHNDRESFKRGFRSGSHVFFGGMSEHNHVPVVQYDGQQFDPAEGAEIETTFSTALFTDAAIQFVEQYTKEEPFLLYLAYTSPHDPRTAPAPYDQMYNKEQIPLPPSFMKEHPFDNGEMHIRDEQLAAYPRQPDEVQQHIADYYAMISHMDDYIKKVIDALDSSGKLDNTIVVYTSDHGLALGRHALMGKQNMYDHSIRVPWLMRGPGIPAGVHMDELAYQFDIFPTLCSFAGLTPPDHIAGQTIAPLILGEKMNGRQAIFSLYKDIQRMVKDDRWKLIWYRQSSETNQGSSYLQLFDLINDPWELNNLAERPEYHITVNRLQQMLIAWMDEVGDSYGDKFVLTSVI